MIVRRRRFIELRGIKPADRQQNLERDIAAGCLDQPITVEPVIEPCFDLLGLLPGNKIEPC